MRALVAIAVMLTALPAGAVSTATAAGEAQASAFDVVFRVDEAGARVLVELTLSVADPGPLSLTIHGDAVDVEATARDDAVPVRLGDADEIQRTVSLDVPDGAREVAVRYAIASAPPRSDGYTRINRAYVAFLAWVDPGLGRGSVRIELPPGFAGDLDRSVLDLESRGPGGEVWVAPSTDAASAFYDVAARNEAGLLRSRVNVEGREVTVAGWEDDPEWIGFAEETIGWGVPAMADLIGQPWPAGALEVLESTIPAEFGYGGWFSVWQSEIEVGDQLDETLLLHELAHAWFHSERIEDRWITEGWAEDISNLALAVRTGEDLAPPPPDLDAPGTTELARWGEVSLDDFDSIANRYDTSWYVLRAIREEIGAEATEAVFAAIFEGRRSYHVDGDAAVFPTTSTARLLDLFQDVGGSELAEELFRTYVFAASSAATLDERAAARAAYDDLLAVGDFDAPDSVRDRLGRWRFAEARLLIDQARTLAERLDALDERAEAAGTDLPPMLVRAYEDETMSPSDLAAELDSAEAALAAIEDADGDARQTRLRRFSSGTFDDIAGGSTDDGFDLTLGVVAVGVVVVLALFGVFASFAFRAARRL